MSDVVPAPFLSLPVVQAQGLQEPGEGRPLLAGTESQGLKGRWQLCVLTPFSHTTQEICLSDAPVVMTLVDGPTEESDNLICVAYRHQFDVVNESTGEAFRLHHVEANRVSGQMPGQVGSKKTRTCVIYL